MKNRMDIFPLIDVLRAQLINDQLSSDEYLFLKNLLIKNWKQVTTAKSDDPGEKQIALERLEDILAKITSQHDRLYPQKSTKQDSLDHLYTVGEDKPLGSIAQVFLPTDEQERKKIINSLEAKRLKLLWLSEEESNYLGGALYVYHPGALSKLLIRGEEILKEAGWPSDPEAFIRKLRENIKQRTPLFDLVCEAYNDQENYGQTKFAKNDRNI